MRTRIADQDDCDLSVVPARHPGADARSRHPQSRQPLMPLGAMSASGHTRLRPARRRVSVARLSILLPGCEYCRHGSSARCWAAAGKAMPDTEVAQRARRGIKDLARALEETAPHSDQTPRASRQAGPCGEGAAEDERRLAGARRASHSCKRSAGSSAPETRPVELATTSLVLPCVWAGSLRRVRGARAPLYTARYTCAAVPQGAASA